jgi:hypothetical protein
VIVCWIPPCGHCNPCRRGQSHLCLELTVASIRNPRFRVGQTPYLGLAGTGTFAEELTLPLQAVVPLPEDVPFEIGTVMQALQRPADAIAWYKTVAPPSPLHQWVPHLAALLESIPPKAVRTTVKRLALPRRQADIVRRARVRGSGILSRLEKDRARPSQTAWILSGLPDELLIYLLAKAPREQSKQQIRHYMADYRWIRPRLTGSDLKTMGLKPGPVFKRVLDRLLAARMDGEVKTEADERELVRKLTKT